VTPRAGSATLEFAVAGGRTQLLRQHVSYPFHLTRPFHLDRLRPDLATLYLQSASGGIYGGDDLSLDIACGPLAAVCVTTQSATIVHDSKGCLAQQTTRIALAPGALALYTPDPLVLFPGAWLDCRVQLRLAPGARALLQESFACHDPAGTARRFAHCRFETEIQDPAGRLIAADRGEIAGAQLDGPASPLGPWRACGTTLLLGGAWPRPAELQQELDDLGCYAGSGELPNGVGMFLRILAPDGGSLARGLRLAFAHGFAALTDHAPAERRK